LDTTKVLSLTPLALLPPVFGNLLGGLVQPVLVSGQTDHLNGRKPFRRIRADRQRRQLAHGHQNLNIIHCKTEQFRRGRTSRRAGKSLAAQVPSPLALGRQSYFSRFIWTEFISSDPAKAGPLLRFRFVFLKREPNAQQQCQVRRRQRPVSPTLPASRAFQFSRFIQT